MRSAIRKLAGVCTAGLLTAAAFTSTALTGAATAATSGEARVSAINAVNTFQNENTGRCMDDSGAGLRSFGCNGLNFQQWNVTVWADGTRELKNVNTGRCVDDSLQFGLRSYPCNKNRHQGWFVERPGGKLVFKNQETGRCIDDSGAGLRAFACNGQSFQRWS